MKPVPAYFSPEPEELPAFLDQLEADAPLPTHFTVLNMRELLRRQAAAVAAPERNQTKDGK